jgi:hypothetical protein
MVIFVADGYGNSRVVHYSKDGEYLGQWGTKGPGDGEFTLVHDVAIDRGGACMRGSNENTMITYHLSRRTFLRGVGMTMALPWMESRPVWGDDACRPLPRRDVIQHVRFIVDLFGL